MTLTGRHGGPVTSVAFSPDGATLATGGGRGSTYLWDVATGKMIATLADPRGQGVGAVAFAPDGTTLAVGDSNGYTYLWNAATRKVTTTLNGWYRRDGVYDPAAGGVSTVAFASPSGGTVLATGTTKGVVVLWDTATGKVMYTPNTPEGVYFNDPYIGGTASVAFGPGDATVAVGDTNDPDGDEDYTDTVSLNATYKLSDTDLQDFYDPNSEGANVLAFAPDGKSLAVGDANGGTYLWNVATGKMIAAVGSPDGTSISSIAYAPDGVILAIGDSKGHTYLWDIATKQVIDSFSDPSSRGVKSLAFAPHGTALAVGDGNGSTYLWNVASHR